MHSATMLAASVHPRLQNTINDNNLNNDDINNIADNLNPDHCICVVSTLTLSCQTANTQLLKQAHPAT